MISRLLALTTGFGVLALGGRALAQTCASDDDCPTGQVCLDTPCPMPDCHPDETDCKPPPCERVCGETGGGMPWSECASDDDCGAGLVCEEVGGVGCACPPGGDCSDCEPQAVFGCIPAPCQSDADCGEGLVCLTFERTDCGGSAAPTCEPGANCDPAPPGDEPECQTERISFCGPKYIAPCQVDSDCGEGFTCEAREECACSGGGAPVDPDDFAGAPMPPRDDERDPPDSCDCQPSDEKYCRAQELACSQDADCPSSWTCEGQTAAVPCWADPESGETDCADGGVPLPSLCLPPFYGEFPGNPGNFPAEDDARNPDEAHGNPQTPRPNGPREDGNLGAQPAGKSDASGCAGGQTGAGAALTLLVALMLAAALRRQRATD